MPPRRSVSLCIVALAVLVPSLGGAKGCGDSPAFSRSAAPDLQGAWSVAYDDMLGVEIHIGGSVYNQTLAPGGGTVTITHAGVPITFDLDCSLAEIVCPSEAWPTTVSVVQRNATYPHRMFVQIPQQYCTAMEVTPAPADCGADTLNPDCEPVCSGAVATRVQEAFGVIDEAGTRFDLLLGAGVAANRSTVRPAFATSARSDRSVKKRRCVRSRMPRSMYSNFPTRSDSRITKCATFGTEATTTPPGARYRFSSVSTRSGSARCSSTSP